MVSIEMNMHQNNNSEGQNKLSPFAFGWLATAIIFTLYVLGSGIVMSLAADSLSSTDLLDVPPRSFFLATAIGQILFFLIPTLWLAQRHPLGPKEVLRLYPPKLSHVTLTLLGVAACYALSVTWIIAQELYMIPDWFHPTYEALQKNADLISEQLRVGNNIPLLLLALFTAAIIAPISEELVFRGIMQRSFETRLKPFAAMALAGGLFGIVHVQLNNLIPLIGLGLFLGFVSWASRSIWPAIIGHALFNGTQILLENLTSVSSFDNNLPLSGELFIETIPTAVIGAIVLFWVVMRMNKERLMDVETP